ncbi:hypothetical protein [Streptomyces lavendulae]|uniref:hypothetical protein n=1 Tax=Streptomyces lavendulae TaxID=1914 RepID=UPI0024A24DB1|nr:hypothetical protein [Streptomyces lavendulae]GLW01529.1 hypothetical protein Slala05_51600 [Streptomyces lavendulae subsp. lavendulae]
MADVDPDPVPGFPQCLLQRPDGEQFGPVQVVGPALRVGVQRQPDDGGGDVVDGHDVDGRLRLSRSGPVRSGAAPTAAIARTTFHSASSVPQSPVAVWPQTRLGR